MFFICIAELLLFPIYITISGGIIVALVDCYVLYLVQDHIDCVNLLNKLKDKTIWQMTENELADYCYAKGIRGDMLEFVIMVVIHNIKYEEIGRKLGYAVDTLKDWSPKCKAKLGINSWKQDKN